MEFTDSEKLENFMDENEREPSEIRVGDQTFSSYDEMKTALNGDSERKLKPTLKLNKKDSISADFPRVLELPLEPENDKSEGGAEENREGVLIESPENRFFTVGKGLDIEPRQIQWKGRITVIPHSILSPSPELERQRKLELYNVVQPVVQAVSTAMSQGMYQMAVDLAKPSVQILEIQDEKPEDWLPDEVVEMLNNPDKIKEKIAMAGLQANKEKELFVPEGQEQGQEAPVGGGKIVAPSERAPEADVVAPKDTITNPVKDSLREMGKAR